ncbi:hypothetical protein MGAS2096_Spy1268 [Streptococcus pyogenes MGAS2096]|nr:hypothetical protein MGAS2096_Spy1268 [Streptococcus pyogenes MGAS2096]ABF38308.1 hypothetical protein MGAS10750_Spy1357 [Streptococcus pyogenes MGAS10750]EFM33789.1 hypothetical protein HMPREF0841_0629 [Streptococcus pyogenes ATCC 10782]ESA59584.1 hypothetical protein HMPREF1239_1591 [Streptococcus pyogenes GA03805]
MSKPVKKPFLAIHLTSLTFQTFAILKTAKKQNHSENIIP